MRLPAAGFDHSLSMARQYSILLAEDDEIVTGILREFLGSRGFTVTAVTSGEQCFTALDAATPDLLMLDMHLPDMNGLQILNQLRSQSRFQSLPILVISSDLSEDLTTASLERGATEFVYKPIRHDELDIRLRHILDHRSRISDPDGESLALYRVTLSSSFSDDVLARLRNESSANLIKGEKVRASVLFLSIHEMIERITDINAEQIMKVLNQLTGTMMSQVFERGGSVSKVLGDGLLAVFGYPYASERDASNAVQCAAAIIEKIRAFNDQNPNALGTSLRAGIGVATGEIFAGFVGPPRRKEYTVIGPAVRAASKLKRITRASRFHVLTDVDTARLAHGVDLVRVNVRNPEGQSWPAFGLRLPS